MVTSPYIQQWLHNIKNCSFNNTNKIAWARATVDAIANNDYKTYDSLDAFFTQKKRDYDISVPTKIIARNMLQYYWNQIIYFNLSQGSNVKQPPRIVQYTQSLIEHYLSTQEGIERQKFEHIKFKELGLEEKLRNTIDRINQRIINSECWKFQEQFKSNLYILQTEKGTVPCLLFSKKQVKEIEENSTLLLHTISSRWIEILEYYNNSPRIANKVRASFEKRKGMNPLPFYKYLLLEFDDGVPVCFYCNEPILTAKTVSSLKEEEQDKNEKETVSKGEEEEQQSVENLSIDGSEQQDLPSLIHVIPWSLLYSDDLWNLVFCHKEELASKMYSFPTYEDIERLKNRNKRLLVALENSQYKDKKITDSLRSIVEGDIAEVYWKFLKL